ncbi:hypothetical protein DAPPUDRAFT_97204 [Daphnia pulex]|uniref:Uncharacterized protein n=1 Tax=Daphnia pulex TaxID=6669 RepID=E9G0Z1_DAPPU|nr:hypothetical protein DAPPUDRAFT_97204 [Daphnia pulex]|eukprot:EFX86991.1 hypothetical protein DAPPUDRAFT_97204 [Daphnia pulex]
MDKNLFKIHSTRFYDVEPKAIHSMAYESNRLALSRSDNSIEIWNLEHSPHIEKLIPGSPEGSIEALVWSKGRLFSTGLHGFVVEYDLVALSPKASYAVTSGSAWCLAVNKAHTHLAAGSEEGYVCLFEIFEEGLMYYKVFDKQEGRILSLSWHSSGDFIVTGSSNAIRVWNVKTGHAVNRLSLGRADSFKETLVWCVCITDDFVIISGDSRGMTSFWNGKLGTLIDEVNAHKADVLCLCLSEDQKTLYSAGVDPVIVLFARVTAGVRNQWIRSVQRAIHTHDVRSLALAGSKLISGGVDAYLCISSYPPKALNRYPPLPQAPCVQMAQGKRQLLLRYPTSLDVWQLGAAAPSVYQLSANTFLKLSQEPARLLQLKAKDDEWIVCATVSPGGDYVAYATESNVYIYHFIQSAGTLQLKKLVPPEDVGTCHRMMFIHHPTEPDLSARLLLATPKLTLQLVDVGSSGSMKVVHTFSRESGQFTMGDCIHLMDCSADGRLAAVADHTSNIVILDLKSYKVHATLPRYKSHPTALAFHPSSHLLVVSYADHKIVEYDVIRRQYTPFSKKLSEKLPVQWLSRSCAVRHITFDVRHPDVIILHDDSVIYTIDKNKEFSEPDAKITKFDTGTEDSLDAPPAPLKAPSAQQQKLNSTAAGSGPSSSCFGMSKKYKHLAYFGALDVGGELVAVEVSPLALEKHLPPALYKKRFGV